MSLILLQCYARVYRCVRDADEAERLSQVVQVGAIVSLQRHTLLVKDRLHTEQFSVSKACSVIGVVL